MEDIAVYVGALGVGLISGGVIGLVGRRKRRKLAAAGDEDAKRKFEEYRTLETIVAPLLLVVGVCLLGVKAYADYQTALTPVSPEKALERAMKSFPKSN